MAMTIITPSQTVGPFFAYGLAPKGRAKWDPNGTYSWKETVTDNLVTPDATGEKIHIEGHITDGDGNADQRRHDRDLAGGRARAAMPAPPTPARGPMPNSRASAARRPTKTASSASTPSSRARCRGRTAKAGAAYRRLHLFARHAAADLYAALFLRRGGKRPPTRSSIWCRRSGAERSLPTRRSRNGQPGYRFDIRVQGDNETVFFDI